MQTGLVIRAAADTDIPSLYTLIDQAYRGERGRRGWSNQANLVDMERINAVELSAIINDPDQDLLVADEGNALIGCVQVGRVGPTTCDLNLLCVDPRRQALGIGKQLIAAAEQAAVQAGADTLEMVVVARRKELVAYYARRGYRPTGEQRPFPVEGVLLPLLVLAKTITTRSL